MCINSIQINPNEYTTVLFLSPESGDSTGQADYIELLPGWKQSGSCGQAVCIHGKGNTQWRRSFI